MRRVAVKSFFFLCFCLQLYDCKKFVSCQWLLQHTNEEEMSGELSRLWVDCVFRSVLSQDSLTSQNRCEASDSRTLDERMKSEAIAANGGLVGVRPSEFENLETLTEEAEGINCTSRKCQETAAYIREVFASKGNLKRRKRPQQALYTGRVYWTDFTDPATGQRIQIAHPIIEIPAGMDSKQIRRVTGQTTANAKSTENRPIVGREFMRSCVDRRAPLNSDSHYHYLCKFCWVVRALPVDYYPRYLNEQKCWRDNSPCLNNARNGDSYGQCQQQYLTIPILKNKGTSDCPKWTRHSISIRSGCACKLRPYSPVAKWSAERVLSYFQRFRAPRIKDGVKPLLE